MYYHYNTQGPTAREHEMDFLRKIETRDWVIAAVAFVAGAWIF